MTKIHKVTKGETLSEIASLYGVSVSDIQKANAKTIKDVNKIQVGWTLVIPEKSGSEIKDCLTKALNDIEKLPSVQKLSKIMGW